MSANSMLLGTLGVKLDAATAEFEKKMAAAQSKIQGIAETAKTVSVASGAAFAAMAAGIAVASKAYDTQIQSERGLTAALKATGKATNIAIFKEQASALQDLSGIGDEVILSQHRMLATFGLNRDSILQLMPGLLDLSSTGMADLKTVTMAAAKAMEGMPGALSRYGIVLTDAQKEIIQTGTEQQRLAIITQKLAAFQGQAALASSTAAGQFRHVSGRIGDITEKIGEMLDKPLAKVLNVVQLSLKAVDNVLGNLSPEFKETAGTIILVVTALLGVTSVIAGLVALAPVLIGAFSAVGAAMLSAFWPVVIVIGAVAAAIVGTLFTIGVLKKAWDSNFMGMRTTIENFVKVVKQAWEFVRDGFVEALKSAKEIGKKILEAIGSAIESFVNSHIGMLRRLGDALGIETLAGLKDIKLDLTFDDVSDAAGGLKDAILDGLEAGADFTVDSIKTGFDVVKSTLGPLFDGLVDGLKNTPASSASTIPGAAATGSAVTGGVAEPEARTAEDVTEETGAIIGAVTKGLDSLGRVLQAFAEGGPIAAIIAIVAEALQFAPTFGKIITKFGQFLANMGKAFEPLLDALWPLIDTVIDLASVVFTLLIKLFPLAAIIVALAPVISAFASAVNFVVSGIIGAYNWIVDSLASVASAIPIIGDDIAKFIRKLRLDIDTSRPAAAETDDAYADMTDSVLGFGDEVDNTTGAMRELNEELSNIPQGFKVLAARFKALDPEMPTTTAVSGMQQTQMASGGGRQVGTVIEAVYIQSLDPDDAWDKMQSSIDRKNFQQTGTSIGTVGPYAAAEGG